MFAVHDLKVVAIKQLASEIRHTVVSLAPYCFALHTRAASLPLIAIRAYRLAICVVTCPLLNATFTNHPLTAVD